mmetsp:Transcript_23428/g.36543  ORF Transcript_23428/g.36543 Transcript_23428/m.36543 type:complete len:521 (-) Transcript_23428:114-1676(-)
MKVYPRGEHRAVETVRLRKLDGKVRKRVESKVDQEVEPEGEYHTTSFGAPAAHVLRFKGGGLYHLQSQLDEKIKIFNNGGEGEREKGKKEGSDRSHHWKINKKEKGERDEIVGEGEGEEDKFGREGGERPVSERREGSKREGSGRGSGREGERMRKMRMKQQAVGVLDLYYQMQRRRDICFSQILPAVATCVQHLMIQNRNKPLILEQYLTIGILLHFESLLSTYQAELGMIADYDVSVSNFVKKIKFNFISDESEGRNSELALEWIEGDGEREGEGGVVGEEQGQEEVVVEGGGEDGLTDLRFEYVPFGHQKSLLVTLPIPPKFYKAMKDHVEGKRFTIIPCFFTQGINEQQTLAIRLGGTAMQERINKQNVAILRKYFSKFIGSGFVGKKEQDYLRELFTSLLEIVRNSKREKEVRVLSLSADLSRAMNGGRLTSCKSAKDRTSMSITWEQARLLCTHHSLSPHLLQETMTVMRSAGVRRENAYKNIGKNKFAFNNLQLKMIPDIYRAPQGTGGAAVT